jgi:hypothetical protein
MLASSLDIPLAIATHNHCRSSRLATEAAPENTSPPSTPEQLPILVVAPFAHLRMKVLQRPIESAL